MGFTRDDSRASQGGAYISTPGTYTVRITEASEAVSNGIERLQLMLADVNTGSRVRGTFDLEGAHVWRTDRLMQALGRGGYSQPTELLGLVLEVDLVPERDPKYLRVHACRPAKQADDEAPF